MALLAWWSAAEAKLITNHEKINELPYPLEYNHGVVFFNMTLWVRSNSKNPKKVDFLAKKKNPKNRT